MFLVRNANPWVVFRLCLAAFLVTISAHSDFALEHYRPLTEQVGKQHEEAQEDLLPIMQEIIAGSGARMGRNTSGLTPGDIPELIRFIDENTRGESAATARLFLALLIVREGGYNDAAISILEDIQCACSDSWQSTIARLEKAAFRVRVTGSTASRGSEEIQDAYEALRCEIVEALPVLQDIDRDTKPIVRLFRRWYSRSAEESIYVSMLGGLAFTCEILGDADAARNYFRKMLEAVPETSSAEWARKQIERIDREDPPLTTFPTGREEAPEELDPAERSRRRDAVLREEIESMLSRAGDAGVEERQTDVAEGEPSHLQNGPRTGSLHDGSGEASNAKRTAVGVIIAIGAVCLLGVGAKRLWYRQ